MRRWNWDVSDIRLAIKHAYRIDKVGKYKYECYVMKKGSKKIIFAYEKEANAIHIISGSEGQ